MSSAAKPTALFRRAEHWWTEELWSPTRPQPIHWPGRVAIQIAKTIYIVATGFRRERIKLRASALTYVSLLSLIPALVVVFSVFTVFTGLDQIQSGLKEFIVQSIAPSLQDIAIDWVERFLKQSRAVGSVGIAILFVTVISLLTNIERAFNDVWGIDRDRSLIHRFQVYWPLITLGPILLGVSLSLTAAFQSSKVAEVLAESTMLFSVFSRFVPFIFISAFLTLLYVMLPNTRVPFKFAFVGGGIAGVLWEAAKQLYAIYARYALARPSIYGSLAAVPLFVLWIYVSWVLALLGATITFAAQNAHTYEPEGKRDRPRSQRDRELLAARLLVAVSERFHQGNGPVPAQELVEHALVGPRFARRVLAELVKDGLLVETLAEDEADVAYVPGRPLESISMADVVRAMRRGPDAKSDLVIPETDVIGQRVCQAILRAEEAVERTLAPATLAHMLEDARAESPTPAGP